MHVCINGFFHHRLNAETLFCSGRGLCSFLSFFPLVTWERSNPVVGELYNIQWSRMSRSTRLGVLGWSDDRNTNVVCLVCIRGPRIPLRFLLSAAEREFESFRGVARRAKS